MDSSGVDEQGEVELYLKGFYVAFGLEAILIFLVVERYSVDCKLRFFLWFASLPTQFVKKFFFFMELLVGFGLFFLRG